MPRAAGLAVLALLLLLLLQPPLLLQLLLRIRTPMKLAPLYPRGGAATGRGLAAGLGLALTLLGPGDRAMLASRSDRTPPVTKHLRLPPRQPQPTPYYRKVTSSLPGHCALQGHCLATLAHAISWSAADAGHTNLNSSLRQTLPAHGPLDLTDALIL